MPAGDRGNRGLVLCLTWRLQPPHHGGQRPTGSPATHTAETTGTDGRGRTRATTNTNHKPEGWADRPGRDERTDRESDHPTQANFAKHLFCEVGRMRTLQNICFAQVSRSIIGASPDGE